MAEAAEAAPALLALDDPAAWGPALDRYAKRWGVEPHVDQRAVGSAWCLAYLVLLLPPWVAAASGSRWVGPATLAGWHLSLDGAGRPLALQAPHGWGAPEPGAAGRAPGPGDGPARLDPEGRWAAYAPLLLGHLPAVLAALQGHCRVPLKVLWGNVARRLAWAFDEALAGRPGGGPQVDRLRADRDALLLPEAWPDGQPNPLAARIAPRYPRRDAQGGASPTHRQCCLYHRLPGQAHCEACPLAPPPPV